jgi:MFS family permease
VPARRHPNATLGILTLACLSYALQQSMVLPPLPLIERELGTTATWGTWVLTVFLLVSCVSTSIVGRLGDQYGKKRMLTISLLLFLTGCAGCAVAWDIWSLIAFRAIAGLGGAVFPLSFAIVHDELPRERVGLGLGVIGSVLGVGAGFGVVLGGVITDTLGWRWMFALGTAVAAVALVLVHRLVPESRVRSPSRVDVPGALLLTAGLLTLLVALTEGHAWGWTSARTLGLFAASPILFAIWTRVELRVPSPLVDVRMLANRTVLFTNVSGLIVGFATFACWVLVPALAEAPRGLPAETARLVHYGFDDSVTRAGLYLLPASLAIVIIAPLTSIVARRTGYKWTLVAGLLTTAGSNVGLAVWQTPRAVVLSQILFGLGVGLAYASMPALITAAVRPTETGVATGLNHVARQVGSVMGGQVGAALLATYTISGTHVPALSAFEVTFAAGAAAAFLGAGAALMVSPRRRAAPFAVGV